MTKREFLINVTEGQLTKEMCDYAMAELEKMDERNANRKPSKAKLEREAQDEIDRKRIFDYLLTCNQPVSLKEIINALSFDYSIQKVSALIAPYRADGTVVRTVIKKIAYYSLA